MTVEIINYIKMATQVIGIEFENAYEIPGLSISVV